MPLSGPPLDQPIDLRNVLARGLESKPDEVALVSAEGRQTWRELDRASDRYAASLLDLGVRKGDRVASLMPNRNALVIHYLACFKAGLVATPLNYRYMPPEIDHALEVSEAAVLLAHAERDADLAASKLAGRLPLGRDPLRRRATAGTRASRSCSSTRLRPAELPTAVAVRSGGHLLHLGQHRQAQGRDPQLRDVRLDAGERGSGLRDDGGRRDPARVVDLAHRRIRHSLLALWRPGRACSSRGPSTATSCCRCCASTGRPCSACCPRRCSPWCATTVPRARTSPRSGFASPAATRLPPSWSASSPTSPASRSTRSTA